MDLQYCKHVHHSVCLFQQLLYRIWSPPQTQRNIAWQATTLPSTSHTHIHTHKYINCYPNQDKKKLEEHNSKMNFNAETLAFLSALLFLTVVLSYAHDDDQQQQRRWSPLQSRAPHGLAFESPMSFSPSAFEFFHPRPAAGAKTANAPLPLSMARADRVVESAWATPESSGGIRGGAAGAVVVTVIGVACVVLVAIGTSYYFLVIKRNSKRASTLIQFHSHVWLISLFFSLHSTPLHSTPSSGWNQLVTSYQHVIISY